MEQKKKPPRNYEYVEDPVNARRFVELKGNKVASEMLGITNLSYMIAKNKVRKTYEDLAGFVLEKEEDKVKKTVAEIKAQLPFEPKKPSHQLIVVKVPSKTYPAIQQFLDALELAYLGIDDL